MFAIPDNIDFVVTIISVWHRPTPSIRTVSPRLFFYTLIVLFFYRLSEAAEYVIQDDETATMVNVADEIHLARRVF